MRDGRVKRETIPDENLSGVQGWFFNLRRPSLQDPRVREAIGNAFDFAWTNKNLMFDAYQRTTSYFQNSDMAATQLPSDAEVALLDPFRNKLPPEVFGAPSLPAEADGSGQDRTLLRRANDLLLSAGCRRQGTALMLPGGRPFELELLFQESGLLPHAQAFIANLKQLGINARIRLVDAAQYKLRLDNFDFDMVAERIITFYSPGEELRDLFGSESAIIHGSRNIAGIADPVVDALIAKAVAATTREELVHICRALDRVLRAGLYWIPHWYKPSHWIAHWDVFGRPQKAPRYNPGIEFAWWYDDEKAKRINFVGR
jgi:microcin C transport system substrate-binding protein